MKPKLTPELVETVAAYRTAVAKEDLLAFAQVMAPNEPPARHHKIIAQLLMGLADGRIERLMIFMPPRAGKSLYGSKYFSAWMLGLRPDTKIVHGTHTGSLADEVGYDIRKLIDDERYPWSDIKIASDRAARTDWRTTAGGLYFGTSMGAGPTGRPANILIIDDPITNAQDADSELIRKRQADEYERGFRSRLQPWADGTPPRELMILTRWSEDDLAGRHLPEGYDGRSGKFTSRMTGEQWTVCSLPARAEHDNDLLGRAHGEWLWPSRFGDDSPWAMTERIGGRAWSSLYQQRPAPEEGVLIKTEWLKFYDGGDLPPLERLTIYGTSDFAVTDAAESRDPDWTVHMIFGVDPDWNVYLLDMWRGRTTSDVWVERYIDLVKLWKPFMWGEEQGQIIKGVGPLLSQRLRERRAVIARRPYPSIESKGARAGEFAAMDSTNLIGMLSMGRWILPSSTAALHQKAMWRGREEQFGSVDTVLREMKQFPAGRHDDTVDTQSLMARMLGDIIEGSAPSKEDDVAPDSLDALFARNERVRSDW